MIHKQLYCFFIWDIYINSWFLRKLKYCLMFLSIFHEKMGGNVVTFLTIWHFFWWFLEIRPDRNCISLPMLHGNSRNTWLAEEKRKSMSILYPYGIRSCKKTVMTWCSMSSRPVLHKDWTASIRNQHRHHSIFFRGLMSSFLFCRYIPTGVLFDLLCAEPERPWNLTVCYLTPYHIRMITSPYKPI